LQYPPRRPAELAKLSKFFKNSTRKSSVQSARSVAVAEADLILQLKDQVPSIFTSFSADKVKIDRDYGGDDAPTKDAGLDSICSSSSRLMLLQGRYLLWSVDVELGRVA